MIDDRCDITVYTQGWVRDRATSEGETPDGLLYCVVHINGREIERCLGIKVEASSDFAEAAIRVSPSTVEFVPLTRVEWDALTPESRVRHAAVDWERTTKAFDLTHDPFDPQRRCRKCGGDASVEYKYAEAMFVTAPERIQRRCTRCDYVWAEIPLDRVTPA